MKVEPMLDRIDSENFITQYLLACGVEFPDQYLNAANPDCCSGYYLDEPYSYYNMDKAVAILENAIKENLRIGVIVDPDLDGITSAALLTNFLINISVNQDFKIFHHIGKGHGLVVNEDEDLITDVFNSKIDLLFIPDAGSNDYEQIYGLKQAGTEIVVLDHHVIDDYKKNKAVVVNPHHPLNRKQLNTQLSGCGVVLKFIEAFGLKNPTFDLYDVIKRGYVYTAISIISDSRNLNEIENRRILTMGLKWLFKVPVISDMVTKFQGHKSRSTGEFYYNINPKDFSFGIIPPINAVTRSNDQETKELLFRVLAYDYDAKDIVAVLKALGQHHRQQTKIVKQMAEEIDDIIDYSHNVNVGFTTSEYKNYIGLAANKFTNEGKPCIVLREIGDTKFSGSLRSPFPVATLINESGIAVCKGHEEAAGIFLDKKDLPKLIEWFDQGSFDFVKTIKVCANLEEKDITLDLCKQVNSGSYLWGTSINNPTFHVRLPIDKNRIFVYNKNTTTVRFDFNDFSLVKFMAPKNFEEKIKESGTYMLDAIIELTINEYNGVQTPQGKITKMEIEKLNWEDAF